MKKLFALLFIVLISDFALCQSFTDSLKAHYTFDGHLLDETRFQNDLQLIDGEIYYSFVDHGDSSIVFNGNSRTNTIRKFDNSDYSEISISLWFKSSIITSQLQIMLQGAYMGFGIYIAPNTGKVIGFFDGSSSGAFESNDVLTDGEWHNVIISSNGSETSMYVDGKLNGVNIEPMVVGDGRENNRLYMGLSILSAQPFTGELNEIRIYNRLLNEREIDTLSIVPKINEPENSECEFNISPNPGNNYVIIIPKTIYTYEVYSINGKYVLGGSGYEIDTSELPSGMYLIKINECIEKLIIQSR